MSTVSRISAVTLLIKDMETSCNFYSKIPGFKLTFDGYQDDFFTTYEIGQNTCVYLNLELIKLHDQRKYVHSKNLVKIILHVNDVDKLYHYFKNDQIISNLNIFTFNLLNFKNHRYHF